MDIRQQELPAKERIKLGEKLQEQTNRLRCEVWAEILWSTRGAGLPPPQNTTCALYTFCFWNAIFRRSYVKSNC